MLTSINPTTAREIKTYPADSIGDWEKKVERAHASFGYWASESIQERAGRFQAVANRLRAQTDELAMLMAEEMGKPVMEGRAEVEKCAKLCDYYVREAPSQLSEDVIETELSASKVVYRPLGVILAIMPWNFPFWQVFRFAVPSLIAGNTTLVKHAPNVTGCARSLEALFRTAGFPEGVFTMLFIEAADVQEHTSVLIADRRIAAVTLTGSVMAGRSVAALAGRHLKKAVLELGGSDPYVVLDDADLDGAVEACVTGRMINGGQSCIGAKRWIVQSGIYDAFLEKARAMMNDRKTGDPLDSSTQLGPLARHDLRQTLDRQVQQSISAGAVPVLGGQMPEQEGFFYPPTILADVKPGMPVYEEEIFGPVAAVIRAESGDEALSIANDTSFGLGAAVFTSSVENGLEWAEHKLAAGNCFVNTFVRSDPRLPFGGIKNSGYGRELGPHGIKEFVNVKTVAVA